MAHYEIIQGPWLSRLRCKVATMKSITLPRPIVNQLLTQAQKHGENEACGLVSMKGDEIARVYPVSNVASDKHTLFEMEPAGQIQALKTMRENGENLFAIYHSHPHTPAEPSPRDIQQAEYPDALYLIISLDTKGVLEMRGFYLKEHKVEPVELHI